MLDSSAKWTNHLLVVVHAIAINSSRWAFALVTMLLWVLRTHAADIPLQYDQKLTSLGFPSPLLRGTINGQTVWFIIDTGAGVHSVASWLIKAANIPAREIDWAVKGSTGADLPVRAVYNQVIRLSASHHDVRLREAVAIDFPAEFQEQRIGGLLSPQLLAPPGTAAVLDLRKPRLSFRDFDAALRRFGVSRKSTETASICSNNKSPFVNRLYAAPMSAAGISGLMLIDTGATRSIAVPSSSIAAALLTRALQTGSTQGVGGSVTATQIVPDVPLRFAGAEHNVGLVIGAAPPSCGGDGLLGMDALRKCVLFLGDSSFAAFCDGTH